LVTDANLFAKLTAYRPHVVHLSGNQNGGDVLFPSVNGGEVVVPDTALAGLLSSLGPGVLVVGALTYSWTASPGFPSVSMTGANTATPTLQLSLNGTYQLTLTVTDTKGVTATATVTVQYI
jgi:hypothetical protein